MDKKLNVFFQESGLNKKVSMTHNGACNHRGMENCLLPAITLVLPAPQVDCSGQLSDLQIILKNKGIIYTVFDFNKFLKQSIGDSLGLLWDKNNLDWWIVPGKSQAILRRISHHVIAASKILESHNSGLICFFVSGADAATTYALIRQINKFSHHKKIALIMKDGLRLEEEAMAILKHNADLVISCPADAGRYEMLVQECEKAGQHYKNNIDENHKKSITISESCFFHPEKIDLKFMEFIDGRSIQQDLQKDWIPDAGSKRDKGSIIETICDLLDTGLVVRLRPDNEISEFDLGRQIRDEECLIAKIRVRDTNLNARIYASPDSRRWAHIGNIFPAGKNRIFSFKINSQLAGDHLFIKAEGIMPKEIIWIKLYRRGL